MNLSKSDVVLKTEGLRKTFKVGFWNRSVTALEHLDVEVRRGEVFGFLGPNGAGKTTTLKILMGLIYPTNGTARILDRPIGDVGVKHQIGFLPESPYFYDYLTGEEFLRFYGQLFGLHGTALTARIEYLLQMIGLPHVKALQLRKFSKGMLQRIGIAQALINDPHLVVLDEPMSGLDPVGRKEVRDLILRLKDEGKTIFFSSHILHDAELLCDRVSILVKGRIVAMGSVKDLVGHASASSIEVVVEGLGEEGLGHIQPMVERIAAQATLISVTPHQSSLEDLFMKEVRDQEIRSAS
jgi:ABC-2 type transport system ATP-binding protein